MRVGVVLLLSIVLIACGSGAPDGDRDAGGATGGYARMTVGDEEWTFSDVYCDPAEGQAFSLQGVEDPVNVLVVVDRVGTGESHYIGVYDHVNSQDVLGMGFFASRDFLRVDGKSVTAELEMVDHRTGADRATVAVTFEGRCP